MRTPGTILLILLLAASTVSASLPRLAVISIDIDDFSPDEQLIAAVIAELASSGRFDIVDLGADAFITTTPDLLISTMTALASTNALDVFLALEVLPEFQDDRTILHDDSQITFRTVEVTVLGRFYSSTGSLLGTIRHTISRESELPSTLDRLDMATECAVILAERSILELFPLEVSFVYDGAREFVIPIGTAQGVKNGTVMSAVASSTDIPDDPLDYSALRSRGLLQITEAGYDQSRARLISGRLVIGGTITALEQSAPAIISGGYCGSAVSVEMGEGLEEEEPGLSNGIRFSVATAKWGLSLGGGFSAGILEHASCLGVELNAGTRLPIGSPELGFRLTGGGEVMFLMQEVRNDSISSDATAVSFNVKADASLEYLFADHLGLELGCSGILGTEAQTWTVQEYSGNIRDADPDELYYSTFRSGPFSLHAGIFYMIF